VIPWHMLAGGVTGTALAALACLIWPLTPVWASLAGGGLAIAGLAAGVAWDLWRIE
jgi:hypothetical protein